MNTFKLFAFLPCLFCTPLQAQDSHSSSNLENKAYIDDDDQRPLADLDFEVDRKSTQNLRIRISAIGPNVEPIAGFRGIHGANRYTAEEFALLLNGTHKVRVATEYESGDLVTGELVEGKYGTLPERRLLPDGRIDFLGRTVWEYPVEITVNPMTSSSGLRSTFVYVNGQARLRCRYRIHKGKLKDLEVQSLGHDGFLALSPKRPALNAAVMFAATDELDTLELPADWNERDIEGKWVYYSRDVLLNPQHDLSWPVTLRKAEEYDLLEMLALSTPDAFKSHGVIANLYNGNAPHWIRVAAWHTNGPPNFGHGMQAATNYITQVAPGVTEDWIDDHRNELDNFEESLKPAYELLRKDKVERGDASGFLPPLNPEKVFANLDPALEVTDFGNRLTAEDGVIYKHQVIRAINAVPVSGRRNKALLDRLRSMTRHDDTSIRRSAFLAHTYTLPKSSGKEKFDDFLAAVENEEEHFTVRQAALMAYSYHKHPSVFLKLHDVASNTEHAAWEAAVSRLGDLGWNISIEILEPLMQPNLSESQQGILRDTLSRLRKRAAKSKGVSSWEMSQRIRMAVFANQSGHPLTDRLTGWVDAGGKVISAKDWNSLKKSKWDTYGAIWVPGTEAEFAKGFETFQASIPRPENSTAQ